MRIILTTLILLLAGSATAFGATADFFFFNKLGLLIALNVVVGGLLTLCFAIVASHLWGKLRQRQLSPVRIRVRQAETLPHSIRGARFEDPVRSRKTVNSDG